MIIAVYSKIFNDRSAEIIRSLLKLLDKLGVDMMIFRPMYEFLLSQPQKINSGLRTFTSHDDLNNDVRFLITVGGDGTFLQSVNIIRNSGIPIVGINIGRLGFLATIAEPELEDSIKKLLAGALPIEERTLLRMDTEKNKFNDFPYALNDVVIQKKNTGLITVHTWYNDDFLNSYWADGLIIATPTGSSAYSMSVGGPIVAPESENFIISPIAPHNLTVRPLIIPDNAVLRLKTSCRSDHFIVSLDSRSFEYPCNTEITLQRANFKVKVIKSSSFYATLRNKLMWGEDKRN
ncbi:MAG: NAD kinase [Bacteroidales bacterium]|jgi:NAD+ kinase|nr:NAD kinase [Bacteroidales bacterium]